MMKEGRREEKGKGKEEETGERGSAIGSTTAKMRVSESR